MEPAFASASATGGTLREVLEEVASRAAGSLGPGGPPDLAVLFVTPDFGPGHSGAGPTVLERTGARHLLGCSGNGVIGVEAEREGGHAAALLLARLPGVQVRPFRFTHEDWSRVERTGDAARLFRVPRNADASFLLLVDPFTADAEALLVCMNEDWPGRPVVGGLASGAERPGNHALWLDDGAGKAGAVGVALIGGSVAVRPLVSQGCRPIGRRFTVTKAEGPRIFTLAGKPAAEALRGTLEGLSEEDRALARTSLHLGRAAHEARSEFHRGDFLIRNLMAVVPEDGSLVAGDQFRPGPTVLFQLRDAAAATEDLSELLDMEAAVGRPAAGLLFSCGGRGSRLFGEPDHDLDLVRRRLGEFPLAGFFCNGEIGPVGPRNFVHGFTSSMALFSVR